MVALFWVYVDVQCCNVAVASFCAVACRCSEVGMLGVRCFVRFVVQGFGLLLCYCCCCFFICLFAHASISLGILMDFRLAQSLNLL